MVFGSWLMSNNHVNAKERFEITRSAIRRLEEVKLAIMLEGEDWRPQLPKSRRLSDPTANKAIYRADELKQVLENLAKEEHELETYIGTSLKLIEAVRIGLGDKYANILDARYVDFWNWKRIEEEYEVTRQHGNYIVNVACDWIDSVGVKELLRGELEL